MRINIMEASALKPLTRSFSLLGQGRIAGHSNKTLVRFVCLAYVMWLQSFLLVTLPLDLPYIQVTIIFWSSSYPLDYLIYYTD